MINALVIVAQVFELYCEGGEEDDLDQSRYASISIHIAACRIRSF